jgi:hypothetical protein
MGTNSYDNPAGLDISWSYRSDDATLLTVYAYPHHEPHPEFTDLDWATAEVRTSASQVTDVEWGDTMMMETGAYSSPSVFAGGLKRLPLGPMIPPDMHAEVAAELGLESLDGVTRAFPVLVLVQSFDGWFLKLRATWMDEQVPAQRMVQQLSGWSGMPCAYFEGQGLPMVDMDGE